MDFEKRREKLVKRLKRQGRIESEAVEKAFLEIPREKFISNHQKENAYADTPLQIGERQTISAPHMIAIMCEALDIKEGQKILEIGAGSGYHAAIVSRIVGEKGHVYTIERFTSLAEKARENLKKADIKNVTVVQGDGSEGLPEKSPYERIYVTCASPDIPDPLVDQLKKPGKLLIPVGRRFCRLQKVEKRENGEIASKDLGGCAFVPLVGKHGF